MIFKSPAEYLVQAVPRREKGQAHQIHRKVFPLLKAAPSSQHVGQAVWEVVAAVLRVGAPVSAPIPARKTRQHSGAALGLAELCLLQFALWFGFARAALVRLSSPLCPLLYCEFREALQFIKSCRFHSKDFMVRAPSFPIPLQLCISQTS